MIDELVISNFKGIRQCEIKNVGRVNLFIGKNDSGKSSIMEAIYATTQEYSGFGLEWSIQRKTDRMKSGRTLWYGYDLTLPIQITLKLGENILGLRLLCDGDVVRSILMQERPERYTRGASKYDLTLHCNFNAGKTSPVGPDSVGLMDYFDYAIFLDCSMKTNMAKLETAYLERVKLSGKIQDFADLFATIYNKEGNGEFTHHPDFPEAPSRFTIRENEKSIFIDDLGDGPRYGAALCAGAMSRQNTGIFIEEIESHQHPEALKTLAKKLVELSQANNLQFFITTHSLETWKTFSNGAYDNPEKRKTELRTFHVERSKDGIVHVTNEETPQKVMKIFEVETPTN